ncbi:response regulator [Marinobacter caseinilyticus]|uniref:response regulator n=1 Tax=Marinobacter caseinilyticus TaxID=2692195 RepID=UPI00140DC9CF|nr:response regulator [Marinobacter caseinilyticus]
MATVLLIEDDELLRVLLGSHLESAGFTVIQAEDGLQAQSIGVEFDVVLCDLIMPNMDGVSFIEWIKADRPGTRIVTLSGADDPSLREKLEGLGVAEHFIKPLSSKRLEELATRLKALVND